MPRTTARIVIAATPRSGNTWLRGMLSRLFEAEEIAIHDPADLDWAHAPDRCVVQLHWWRAGPFLDLLRRHEFRVVTLARHPLDVMISTLNYSYYAHDGERCTIGDACWPCQIRDASPRSPEFLRYVREWPGRNILSYSPSWWGSSEAHLGRYEELVEDTEATLGRLTESLGLTPRRPLTEAAVDYDMERLRVDPQKWHYHYWQGRPGLWRMLLPPEDALAMASAHREVFRVLGYACDPDASLTPVQADLNWYRLQHGAMRKHLRDEKAKHEATRGQLDEATGRLDATGAELGEARRRMAEVEGLGPRSIDLARKIHRISKRHPALSSALRKMVRVDRAGRTWGTGVGG